MPKKRKQLDWEAIEREYRAGQLSIREIARQHGCSDAAIHKRAKKDGWVRDLAEKVRRQVSANLVSKSVSTPNASDKEIIEAAATRGAEVVEIHRRDIQSLRTLVADLRHEVATGTKLYITQYQGEIVEKVVSLTAAEKSAAIANLAAAEHKLVALERQAFSLDEPGADDNEIKLRVVYDDGGPSGD